MCYCSYPFDLVELSPLRLLTSAITITVSAVVILRINTIATTPPMIAGVLSVSEHVLSEDSIWQLSSQLSESVCAVDV